MTKPHSASLLAVALAQSTILLTAWTFYAVIRMNNPLPLSDSAAQWVHRNPTETTIIVTMIATVVHFITLSCFTIAMKHALRQRIARKPISLAELSFGVAAARASFAFNRRYIWLTLGILLIFVAFGLVNSAWTAFLNPVPVTFLVPMTGTELDLSSPDFDVLLNQAIDPNTTDASIANTPQSSASLTSLAFMGGATAATTNVSGQAGLFLFNTVQYNTSTGGILPGVTGYTGPQASNTSSIPSVPRSAMFFSNGHVPANMSLRYEITGISRTYTIDQQGFTANVSLHAVLQMGSNGPGDLNFGQKVINTSILSIRCKPDSDVYFGLSFTEAFDQRVNSVTTLPCPNINDVMDTYPLDNITIIHQGSTDGVYNFLPPTACIIRPLVTRSSVTYANQLVSSHPMNSTAVSYQLNLMIWLAYFIYQPMHSFQSDAVNTLGNLLESLVNPGSSQPESTQAQAVLEEFWRGVVELGGTSLRAGFTAYLAQNQSLGSDMMIPVEGWQSVTTMGWSFRDLTHVYTLFPITFTAVLTCVAIFYALRTARGYERVGERRESTSAEEETLQGGDQERRYFMLPPSAMATFDASDPVHIVVASASEKLDFGSKGMRDGDYWGQYAQSVISFRRGEVVSQYGDR